MRQLKCLLAGVAGAIVALIGILIVLAVSLSVILERMSRGKGEVGWDPVSLTRLSPILAATALSAILAIIAGSFVFAYASSRAAFAQPR
jgi:hypothetical protein